jgi:glycopeptide antibiotics resistance protein
LELHPIFFPAIGIPALFLILIPQLRRTNKWLNKKVHLTANIISITGLISWELIQLNSTKLLFDWNDIVWTLIGALVFHLIFIFIPKSFKELND